MKNALAGSVRGIGLGGMVGALAPDLVTALIALGFMAVAVLGHRWCRALEEQE